MKRAAHLLFYVWVAAAVLFGLGASLAATWELPLVYGLDLDGLATGDRAALLNQYRFLRGLEAGVGVLFFVLRRDVFEDRRIGGLFVVVAGAGAAGRLLSLVLDGAAVWTLCLFVFEAGAALGVGFYLRSQPTGSPT